MMEPMFSADSPSASRSRQLIGVAVAVSVLLCAGVLARAQDDTTADQSDLIPIPCPIDPTPETRPLGADVCFARPG
ncbi:hypothetical protein MB27_31470 [Actinoplanes utahensis]|uniref:Uncharacterized protein n=1 Tax=Actinoplanes utahensis TaxID=1869 RepID=A0A0A6X1K9_ACTUT|nr:hypothetical protein MB27_31470 [Actinoplanes utahensis]